MADPLVFSKFKPDVWLGTNGTTKVRIERDKITGIGGRADFFEFRCYDASVEPKSAFNITYTDINTAKSLCDDYVAALEDTK